MGEWKMANKLEDDFDSTKALKDETTSPNDLTSTVPNYTAIAESPEFKSLKSKKRKFIVPASIFFLVCYIILPILTSYTTILNANAFGDVAWVWVYAMGLFIMTWTLVTIYVSKANGYDREANVIFEKEKAGEYK